MIYPTDAAARAFDTINLPGALSSIGILSSGSARVKKIPVVVSLISSALIRASSDKPK